MVSLGNRDNNLEFDRGYEGYSNLRVTVRLNGNASPKTRVRSTEMPETKAVTPALHITPKHSGRKGGQVGGALNEIPAAKN